MEGIDIFESVDLIKNMTLLISLEVVDGLPLFPGASLAKDTTLVSLVSRDDLPHPRCVREDGAALAAARRRKERTCPELKGRSAERDSWCSLARWVEDGRPS